MGSGPSGAFSEASGTEASDRPKSGREIDRVRLRRRAPSRTSSPRRPGGRPRGVANIFVVRRRRRRHSSSRSPRARSSSWWPRSRRGRKRRARRDDRQTPVIDHRGHDLLRHEDPDGDDQSQLLRHDDADGRSVRRRPTSPRHRATTAHRSQNRKRHRSRSHNKKSCSTLLVSRGCFRKFEFDILGVKRLV